MKSVSSNGNSFLIIMYEYKIEVWKFRSSGKNGNSFFLPALQISSQPFDHFTGISSL